jgi:hypothetical protein
VESSTIGGREFHGSFYNNKENEKKVQFEEMLKELKKKNYALGIFFSFICFLVFFL